MASLGRRMTGLSVLVADDEPLARRRLSRLLGKMDWVGAIAEAGDVDRVGDDLREGREALLRERRARRHGGVTRAH